jgi:hypothetical protein
VYNLGEMKHWRSALLLLALVFCAVLIRSIWKCRAAQQREIAYQSALATYAKRFGSGENRKTVEDYLKEKRIEFGQMCCVERRESHTAYADLIRIGQEDAPWYCSENYVFIAIEFDAAEPNQLVLAQPSDSLKNVSIFRQLGGCL